MTVYEYEQAARTTVQYPEWAEVLYPLLGLVGEAGELVTKFYDAMWPYGQPVPEAEVQFQDALLAMVAVGRRCETLKKMVRGDTIALSDGEKRAICDRINERLQGDRFAGLPNEVADVVWYCSALLNDIDASLQTALRDGLAKLAARKAKNAIHTHAADSQDHK